MKKGGGGVEGVKEKSRENIGDGEEGKKGKGEDDGTVRAKR